VPKAIRRFSRRTDLIEKAATERGIPCTISFKGTLQAVREFQQDLRETWPESRGLSPSAIRKRLRPGQVTPETDHEQVTFALP
jgi:hypothetical protein